MPARAAPALLLVVLLAATAAAFAVTERLKLVRSPILATRIENKVFSPVCGCASEQATVSFGLREADRITVAIVDGAGTVVTTLVDSERTEAGGVAVSWSGRDAAGAVVPEGVYRPRVHLAGQRRTIVLPNPIRVDVTPPDPPTFDVVPRAFSPDGDGRNDKVAVPYRLGEHARGLLFVDGERQVRSRRRPLEGKLDWFGIVDGDPLPAGTYELAMAAEDEAGNVSRLTEPVPVEIHYVELARDLVSVRALARFGIVVRADAERVRWRFAGGRGTTEPGLLVLRAPRNPGRYTLFVEANGRADRARVIVVPAP